MEALPAVSGTCVAGCKRSSLSWLALPTATWPRRMGDVSSRTADQSAEVTHLTPKQVAQRLQWGYPKVLRAIRAGILPALDLTLPGSRRAEYRVPLTLRYLVGADYETIQTQMGLSKGAVRGLLHRGIGKLRAEMQKLLGDAYPQSAAE